MVRAAGHVAPPAFMREIPGDGLRQPVLEADAALLAELGCKLACIDGVAVVVPRAVGDIADQAAAGCARRCGAGGETRGESVVCRESAVDEIADRAYDV